MVAHYNVKAWLRGDPLPFSGGQIGRIMDTAAERGRELGAAERDSEQYWVAGAAGRGRGSVEVRGG